MTNLPSNQTVCLVVPDMRPSLSVEYYCIQSIQHFVSLGHQLTIAFERRGGAYDALHKLAISIGCEVVLLSEFQTEYWTGEGPQSNFKSHYHLLQYLSETHFDCVVAPEHRGLLYYCLLAKTQGIEFQNTRFVTLAVDATLAALFPSDQLINYVNVLAIAFLERKVCEFADNIVTTERMLTWMREGDFSMDESAISLLAASPSPEPDTSSPHSQQPELNLLLVATPEHVLNFFIKTLKLDLGISQRFAKVRVFAYDFLRYQKLLEKQLKGTPYDVQINKLSSLDEFEKNIDKNSLTLFYRNGTVNAWVPNWLNGLQQAHLSPMCSSENAPLTVDDSLRRFEMSPAAMAARLIEHPIALQKSSTEKIFSVAMQGLARPKANADEAQIAHRVLDEEPLVTLCVVHHERPNFLRRALQGFAQQTYKNLQLIVIDDGSRSYNTKQALISLEQEFSQQGWTFLYQENKWLGAARNAAAKHAQGEYLVFFDDDNIPLPHMIETYVKSIRTSGCDLMTCFQLSFVENEYQDYANFYPEPRNVIIPIGGAAAVGQFDNFFGDASCIVKADVFKSLGGYWEHYGLPKEDHDFFCRATNQGFRMQVVPTPLYYYRLCNTGMMRSNSANGAFNFSVNQIVAHQNLNVNDALSRYELQALHLLTVGYWCAKQDYYRRVPHWVRVAAENFIKFPSRVRKVFANPRILFRR